MQDPFRAPADRRPPLLLHACLSAGLSLACAPGDGDEEGEGAGLSPEIEALLKPDGCRDCHPTHHEQWLSSRHAYAAEDPVFRAMNQRYLRENPEGPRDFCVGCHAPMALALGLTEDGSNLDELPQWSRGVTCYYCHNIDSIAATDGLFNNPIHLAMDNIMRGGVDNPVEARSSSTGKVAHASAFSELLDGDDPQSSEMCGGCHDARSPNGVDIKRSHAEWSSSIYNAPVAQGGESCASASCHAPLPEVNLPIAVNAPNVQIRDQAFHDHRMAAVDLNRTAFPDAVSAPPLQAMQREAMAALRESAICASLCVRPSKNPANPGGVDLSIWLHNESAGHSWPSGIAHDRRAWLEVSAFAGGQEVFGFGHVAEGQSVREVTAGDRNNWTFFDRLYNAQGQEVHMPWAAAEIEPGGLPANNRELVDPESSSWVSKIYSIPVAELERVEMRLHLRPLAQEVLADLVASGDLDPLYLGGVETFEMPGAHLIWPTEENKALKTKIFSDTGAGVCVSSTQSCRSPAICQDRLSPLACREPPQ